MSRYRASLRRGLRHQERSRADLHDRLDRLHHRPRSRPRLPCQRFENPAGRPRRSPRKHRRRQNRRGSFSPNPYAPASWRHATRRRGWARLPSRNSHRQSRRRPPQRRQAVGARRFGRSSPARRKRLLDAHHRHQENPGEDGEGRESRRKENESGHQGKSAGGQGQKIAQDQRRG